MKRLIRGVVGKSRPLWRPILRRAAATWPGPAASLTTPLARDGGRPVRDVERRPWPTTSDGNLISWHRGVGAAFRRVYLNGVEGLPQPEAVRFAAEWAHACGARHGLLVGHGTDALRIALAAALDHDGLDYGGEIIVPNLSFIASATAALDRRFGVALVDVDPGTLLLDPVRVEEAITPGRTRAIMAVHLFGQPAAMTPLLDIARRHRLKVIEDAAQAHGAAWNGQGVGSIGDVGAFSFQSSKILSSGEGGALVTSDEEIFDRAYSMQNVGRSRSHGGRWDHVTLGWNCRPTEYQAVLLRHRAGRLESQQRTRAGNFDYLRQLLAASRAVAPLAVHPVVTAHAMYMFVMRYRPEHCGGLPIDEFLKTVRREGAPIVRGFAATIAQQPAIRHLIDKRAEYVRVFETPVADQAVRETLYVPHEVFLGSRRDMEDIAAAVLKVEHHCSSAVTRHG